MAKGAADYIPGLPAGTETIPSDLLDMDAISAAIDPTAITGLSESLDATAIPIGVEDITATDLAGALTELQGRIAALEA